jgi:hypothetical protein
MSVKAMSWVWDQNIERDEKFVLLAYADHADHEGNNIYPAVATIAKKTGYSERSVQRITRQLVAHEWLIDNGVSQYQTHNFSIPIYRGDKMTPPTDGGTDEAVLGGDNLAGVTELHRGGDTHVTGGVTKTTQRGDIAMSPKPSLTINKPSIKPVKDSGAERPHDERLSHPAITTYRSLAKITPPDLLRDDIISTVGDDFVKWGNVIKDWIGHGWKKTNITGMLDYYKNGGNGSKPARVDTRQSEIDATLKEIFG